MKKWVDIALEEGVRFFVTALGNPDWVVEKVHAVKGTVYHDVTERKWAEKAASHGVDGFICVNNRAGGHAGTKTPADLIHELQDMKLPLICAGGIGSELDFVAAMKLGYAGVQMGTRFIATKECAAHQDYKDAILNAEEDDIVRTERVTGVPLSVIKTPYVEKVGLKVGPLARQLFKFRKTRHWIRMYYNLKALRDMKRTALEGFSTKDYWQAGKSVAGISKIEPAGDIVRRYAEVLRNS
jgi:nitronate monooxygenase